MSCTPIRFIINNWLRDAILSSTPATATPLDNLKTSIRSDVMRYTNLASPLVITGILPEQALFSGFAIDRHTLSAIAGIRFYLYEDANTAGTPIYDSGQFEIGHLIPAGDFVVGVNQWAVPEGGNADPVLHKYFNQTYAQSFKIVIDDTANPDGFFDIGQIFLGETFEPQYNFSWGYTIQHKTGLELRRTEGGSAFKTGNQETYRILNINLENLTPNDRRLLSSHFRRLGAQSFWVSAFPDDEGADGREFAMSCFYPDDPAFNNDYYQNWQTNLSLLES